MHPDMFSDTLKQFFTKLQKKSTRRNHQTRQDKCHTRAIKTSILQLVA